MKIWPSKLAQAVTFRYFIQEVLHSNLRQDTGLFQDLRAITWDIEDVTSN